MQYLLSEDEHRSLLDQIARAPKITTQQLQWLCTTIAVHLPITRGWSPEEPPEPWGCVLLERPNNPGYCDRCPARSVCPYPYKRLSK